MGTRLSRPSGVGGLTESTAPAPPRPRFNSRQLIAPAAAFTMAGILFVYARLSIRAAKANAQRHREADSGGGGVNLLKESRRRHGAGERVEEGGTVRQLASEAKEEILGGKRGEKVKAEAAGQGVGEEAEERLKAVMGKRRGS